MVQSPTTTTIASAIDPAVDRHDHDVNNRFPLSPKVLVDGRRAPARLLRRCDARRRHAVAPVVRTVVVFSRTTRHARAASQILDKYKICRIICATVSCDITEMHALYYHSFTRCSYRIKRPREITTTERMNAVTGAWCRVGTTVLFCSVLLRTIYTYIHTYIFPSVRIMMLKVHRPARDGGAVPLPLPGLQHAHARPQAVDDLLSVAPQHGHDVRDICFLYCSFGCCCCCWWCCCCCCCCSGGRGWLFGV
jgi:hypothetical protein